MLISKVLINSIFSNTICSYWKCFLWALLLIKGTEWSRNRRMEYIFVCEALCLYFTYNFPFVLHSYVRRLRNVIRSPKSCLSLIWHLNFLEFFFKSLSYLDSLLRPPASMFISLYYLEELDVNSIEKKHQRTVVPGCSLLCFTSPGLSLLWPSASLYDESLLR